MAEHRLEHDKAYQYEDEAEHIRRSDRSTVRTVWRSLNSPATPNQVATVGVPKPCPCRLRIQAGRRTTGAEQPYYGNKRGPFAWILSISSRGCVCSLISGSEQGVPLHKCASKRINGDWQRSWWMPRLPGSGLSCAGCVSMVATAAQVIAALAVTLLVGAGIVFRALAGPDHLQDGVQDTVVTVGGGAHGWPEAELPPADRWGAQ